MAYPIPNYEGIVNYLDKTFVHKLRRRLTAAALFAGHEYRVPDLGFKKVEWKETADMDGAVISMNIPALDPSIGPGYTDKSVEIPVITKDLHYDEREIYAMRRSGVDGVAAEQVAWAMAKEHNKYLLFGNSGGPGAQSSILNHANMLTLDVTTSLNFSNGNDMVKGLNQGIRELVKKYHYGPFALVMDPADSDLWGNFITNTSVQTRDKIPALIQGQPLYEEEVPANKMYLVEVSSDNYDYVTPFGLGRTEKRVKIDPVTKSLDLRWMMAGSPRVKRGDAVCEITFDRA